MNDSPIRIVIAEDQAMILGALAALLQLSGDFKVVGQARDGREAIEILRRHRVDMVLTDIEMPNMTGIELAQAVRDQFQHIKVTILTTFARAGYLQRALDAGAKGYLLKDTPSDQLASALHLIHQGQTIIDPTLALEQELEQDPLNDRERKMLRLAGEGLSTQEIAESVFKSEGTVRNTLSDAMHKLNCKNRIEAARLARQKGWL